MPVHVSTENGPHAGLSRASVARSARAMMQLLQMGESELSVLLTGDVQIAILNRIYRRKDRPTDVLAFAQREGEHGDRAGAILGDVVISVETAQRQARSRGVDVSTEVTMLLAHGLLHLLGWDHDTPAKDRRMRGETERLCEAARGAGPTRRPHPAHHATSAVPTSTGAAAPRARAPSRRKPGAAKSKRAASASKSRRISR